MKMIYRLAGATLLLAGTSNIAAKAETVEGAAQGEANKDIRIGVFVNIQPDCTSGPLPTIRLVEPPAHGKVTVKKGNFNATNYKQCLALTVPAYVAFYRSEKDYLGSDSVLLEVRYPSGKQELQQRILVYRIRSSSRLTCTGSPHGDLDQNSLVFQSAACDRPEKWSSRRLFTCRTAL